MFLTAAEMVVETGSGLVDANSYQTLSGASGYFERVGVLDEWEGFTEDEQATFLVSGCLFIERRWRLAGYRTTSGQSLHFPAIGAFDVERNILWDEDQVPSPVPEAQCEYALLASRGVDLWPPADPSQRGAITQRSETIGPHSESFTYARPLRFDRPSHPQADSILLRSGLVRGPRRTTIRG